MYDKILVTGGAGFIGSHLVDRLIKDDFEVMILDNFSSGCLENINDALKKKNAHLIKGDVRNIALVKQAMAGVDAVFHEAAHINIAQSIEDPVLTNDINITGTLNLLKIASDSGVRRFIFASSAAVYGESSSEKIEDMVDDAATPYGITKFAAEKYLKIFYDIYGIETISLRYFNVYGPRQNFDINSQYGGVIAIFLNRLLRNLSPIIFGDGKQNRDFIYVQDVIEANMSALSCKNAEGDVYNIGSGTRTSINNVAENLKTLLNKQSIKNIYLEGREGDARDSCANIKKALEILGWTPHFTFYEGLSNLVSQYTQAEYLSKITGK